VRAKPYGTEFAQVTTNYEGIWSELKKGFYILLFALSCVAVFFLPSLAMFLLTRLVLSVAMMAVFIMTIKLGIYLVKMIFQMTPKSEANSKIMTKLKAIKTAAITN